MEADIKLPLAVLTQGFLLTFEAGQSPLYWALSCIFKGALWDPSLYPKMLLAPLSVCNNQGLQTLPSVCPLRVKLLPSGNQCCGPMQCWCVSFQSRKGILNIFVRKEVPRAGLEMRHGGVSGNSLHGILGLH